MNDFSIRITRREGDIEQSIDIDCSSPLNGFPNVKAEPSIAAPVTPSLEWSATLCDGKSVDYAAAEKACAALGEGWRLPTRFELESILDLTRHDPAIDTTRFPDTKSSYYWTSTPCAWSSGYAWVVGFSYGVAGDGHRDGSACVRAVRASSAGQ